VRRVEGCIDVPAGALVVDARDFLVVGWAHSRAGPVSSWAVGGAGYRGVELAETTT
jgi:hypothetical protein